MGKFSSPTGANHRAAATRPRISGGLLGSCCWLAAGLAQADGGNWRWLDSQGRQVFSDLPPPASVPEPRILQRPGPDLPAPAPAPGSTAAGGSPRASAANPEQGQTADRAAQPLARLTRAAELTPTHAEIQMALMRYHLTTPTGKNSEAAWRHADEANRLDPLSTGYDMAEMAERAGELRLAEKYYRVDAANFPVSPWLPFCVARVQLARSATEEARATLTEVLQRFPGFGPAKQMLDGLPPPLAATK